MANSSCTSMLDSECSAHRNRLTQETPTNNPRDKNSPPGAQHRRIGRPRRGPRTLSEQDRRPSAGLECLKERMNSNRVQRVRDAIPGGELVAARSRGRAGLDAAVNFDGICGVPPLRAAEGDGSTRGSRGRTTR